MPENLMRKFQEMAEAAIATRAPESEVIARTDTRPRQLPLWPEVYASPNSVLRSALFRASTKRIAYKEPVELASWANTTISYQGVTLTQAHSDVWMELVSRFRGKDLNSTILRCTAADILRALGLSDNGVNRKRLAQQFIDLSACAVVIRTKVPGKGDACMWGPLVSKGASMLKDGDDPDHPQTHYRIQLNADFANLFSEGFTHIDVETRRMLTTNLAQWLHGYVLSHHATQAHPHRIFIVSLRRLCGSEDRSVRSWRQKIREAMTQLQRVGVIATWNLADNDVLELARPAKHLRGRHR
jgi:hypothetical protein